MVRFFASAIMSAICSNVLNFQKSRVHSFLLDIVVQLQLDKKEKTTSSAIAVMCIFLFNMFFLFNTFVGTFLLARLANFARWFSGVSVV
jgi:heme/copper-type cytochrome/quinol oxidase subunit 3